MTNDAQEGKFGDVADSDVVPNDPAAVNGGDNGTSEIESPNDTQIGTSGSQRFKLSEVDVPPYPAPSTTPHSRITSPRPGNGASASSSSPSRPQTIHGGAGGPRRSNGSRSGAPGIIDQDRRPPQDDTTPRDPRSPSIVEHDSMMRVTKPRHGRTSSDSLGYLTNDEVDMAARGSPTRRRSAGKLVSFIDKLKPSRHPSGGAGGVSCDADDSYAYTNDKQTDVNPKSTRSSRIASGKHTPNQPREASGDYGHFLKAAELQEKLEVEQEKAAQRELKLAKQKKGRPNMLASAGRGPLVTRVSDGSVSGNENPTPLPPLEKTKQFPGGFDGVFDDEERHLHRRHSHHKHSSRSSPQTEFPRRSPVKERSAGTAPSSGTRSPFFHFGSDKDDLEGDAAADRSPSLKRSSSQSSFSTTSSFGNDTITDFSSEHALQQGKVKNASTISLKSWQSGGSGGGSSLASGGANAKLQGPLMELEELELRSFLKNFNRHTREVRVPASLHFPRRRMPQWEDFKIPPGEKELAAKQGKRVTVLTHVDRGLQVLANEEGQGAPLPRSGSNGLCQTSSDAKKGKKATKSSSAGDHNDLEANPSHQPGERPGKTRVTWHPDTGFVPEGLVPQLDEGGEDLSRIGRSFGHHADMYEKDERKAKQIDEQRARSRGQGIVTGPSENIHDSATELRPSRDEVGLTEGNWELINAEAEHEAELDASEGDRVDGVAFCIAYILALVERYAPDELDNTPDQTYREGRARSHLERLYIIAPFWERLLFGLRRLYRWDNPRRTSTAAMLYFVLWWTDLLPTAFFLTLIYYILQFRFFPPDVSYLHEAVRNRMARGVEADKLAERLRRRSRLDILDIYKRFTSKYGVPVQLAAGDIADFHEKVKNLILWRNPPATWRTLTLFGVATVMVTFAPAYYIWKFVLFFIGFTFFCLLPLQSHYPRYRRPLSPFWWALWGVPSDRQFAIQILRRRHLERAQADMLKSKNNGSGGHGKGEGSSARADGTSKSPKKRSEAAHAIKGGSMKPVTGEEQKLFGLEEEVDVGSDGEKRFKPKKLGSFFCQHHGAPGHLTITTRSIYFRGLGRSKSCKTPLEEIAGLAKTKSLQLFVWSSSGLQVARVNKRSLFFSNMVKRDEAFNLILAVGSEGECDSKGWLDVGLRAPQLTHAHRTVWSNS